MNLVCASDLFLVDFKGISILHVKLLKIMSAPVVVQALVRVEDDGSDSLALICTGMNGEVCLPCRGYL